MRNLFFLMNIFGIKFRKLHCLLNLLPSIHRRNPVSDFRGVSVENFFSTLATTDQVNQLVHFFLQLLQFPVHYIVYTVMMVLIRTKFVVFVYIPADTILELCRQSAMLPDSTILYPGTRPYQSPMSAMFNRRGNFFCFCRNLTV